MPVPGGKQTLSSAYHTSTLKQTLSKRADLTVVGMTLKVMREEGGVPGLYRGLVTTAVGVAPYVGINFAAYEALRGVVTPPGKTSVVRKLACGALAGTDHTGVLFWTEFSSITTGSISQTLTYPFDVLRRKMQVTGMAHGGLGYHYNGAFDALGSIIRTEGFRGLYRGLWPNLREWDFLLTRGP
jgi:solute carrier family 25 phosphate transporter 23/24/25/41